MGREWVAVPKDLKISTGWSSGDDRDQALAFMKMDPTDRMEIMIGSQI